MSQEEENKKETKMEIISKFDDLTTAPMGAVVLYRLVFTDTYGAEKSVIIASFDDGNVELPWGIGIDINDALQVASREYSHFFKGSPERRNNPFREVLRS